MPDKLSRLTAIGFTRVGAWQITNRGLTFDVADDSAGLRNVLYAFAVDGALVYVGKTTVALRERLQRYKTPAKSAERGGSTNIKNNRNILQALSAGKAVDIYVLHDASPQVHGGFVVNFAAGLEDSLVAVLSPPWNGRQQVPSAAPDVGPAPVVAAPAVAVVALAKTPASAPASRPTARVTAADFRSALERLLAEAAGGTATHVDVQAGQLHRRVGGYPGPSHAMPVCCDVMRSAMRADDVVVAQPPKGKGASLTIRYRLPR